MTKKLILTTLVAIAITSTIAYTTFASASPIGDDIVISLTGGGEFDPPSGLATVGVGVEFTSTGITDFGDDFSINVDVGDGMILIEYESLGFGGIANLAAHSIHIEDLDWLDESGDPIAGVITGVDCEIPIIGVMHESDAIWLDVAAFPLGDSPTSIHCDFTTEHPVPPPREPARDNVDVENIKLKEGQWRVIVDNAGIGETSDVEITWNFDEDKCKVVAAGEVAGSFGTVDLVDDGAFSVVNSIPVGHNDVKLAEAVLLTTVEGAGDCEIKSDDGQFVAVSTVAMGPTGPMVTSNP